ncbi:MAG: YceI family protein [Betaproteobacteria bacterium]|nr:YceI family protein [Betaproteobacteria bacterium]
MGHGLCDPGHPRRGTAGDPGGSHQAVTVRTARDGAAALSKAATGRRRGTTQALLLGLAWWAGWGAPAEAQGLSGPPGGVLYSLDRTHTFVTFEILHFDTATIRGRFGPLDGEAELDRRARKGRVQVVVDTAQVSTGLPALDALLKQADLLDVQAHPKAYFVGRGGSPPSVVSSPCAGPAEA